ncbi:MAG: superoxide dismutase family protein [Armatimonadetes bacterium]|nr:superoxide dismutase family protein [Armatimonadota bacterium]
MKLSHANSFVTALLLAGSAGVGAAISSFGSADAQQAIDPSRRQRVMITSAVAVIQSTAGNTASGVVRFTDVPGGVRIEAEISGLKPGSKHGFHIHELGDMTSTDGKSMGGHYNPANTAHALPGSTRHAGDMGNLVADSDGVAKYSAEMQGITVAGMVNPIVGRGVVIHALPDDGGQPTGNAGARIGYGVIGIAKAGS